MINIAPVIERRAISNGIGVVKNTNVVNIVNGWIGDCAMWHLINNAI